jgi:hypothetical protein
MTQDAVEQVLASSTQKAFAGVAKLGMGKRCACQQPQKMMTCKKHKTQLIVLSIALTAIAASNANWIQDDLGYLLTIDDIPIDLIGNLKNQVNLTYQVFGQRTLGLWWKLSSKNFLPAVVLIQNANSSPSILAEGIWSGYTNPHKSAPFIRDYLSDQVEAVPAQLLKCFDPHSKSFN